MQLPYPHIAIEGAIGAGKTSLATALVRDFNGKLILERFEENPFLPTFYKDPERYAFQLELSFLADRFQQLRELHSHPDIFNPQVVSDYFFPKCFIFSRVNLKGDEMKLFLRLYEIIDRLITPPSLIVYLFHDVSRLIGNIRKRGREYELSISEHYLAAVQDGYLEYFRHHPELRVIVVDANNLNYVDDESDYRFMKELVEKEYPKGITRIKQNRDDIR